VSTTHELKTWAAPFGSLWQGDKTFEWRRDDRTPRFAVADELILDEYDPVSHVFLGRRVVARVTHLIRGDDRFTNAFGVPAGYVIMSVRVAGRFRLVDGPGTAEWVAVGSGDAGDSDPAPPAAPPAEAELIRQAREHFHRFLSNNGSLDAFYLLPDLADALGRAARERDALMGLIVKEADTRQQWTDGGVWTDHTEYACHPTRAAAVAAVMAAIEKGATTP
jgi:hypothetical protein